MTHKSQRISEFIEPFRGQEMDPRYLAYFDCFNRELFFEAHEVLEDLWLAHKNGNNYSFLKGLIQFAGGFVHLQKGRLRPAAALFKLTETNLKPYLPVNDRLDVEGVIRLAQGLRRDMEETGFRDNPLTRDGAPKLNLQESG